MKNRTRSRKYRKKSRRTHKSNRTSMRITSHREMIHNKSDISQIVAVFLKILNTIKVYHWNTHSFAQHKATDELYDKLNDSIDKFVEILLGKDRVRITELNNRAHRVDIKDTDMFKYRMHEYREFLIDMNAYFNSRGDSDLLSVRDEILGDVNQFLYLMTFDA